MINTIWSRAKFALKFPKLALLQMVSINFPVMQLDRFLHEVIFHSYALRQYQKYWLIMTGKLINTIWSRANFGDFKAKVTLLQIVLFNYSVIINRWFWYRLKAYEWKITSCKNHSNCMTGKLINTIWSRANFALKSKFCKIGFTSNSVNQFLSPYST